MSEDVENIRLNVLLLATKIIDNYKLIIQDQAGTAIITTTDAGADISNTSVSVSTPNTSLSLQ